MKNFNLILDADEYIVLARRGDRWGVVEQDGQTVNGVVDILRGWLHPPAHTSDTGTGWREIGEPWR